MLVACGWWRLVRSWWCGCGGENVGWWWNAVLGGACVGCWCVVWGGGVGDAGGLCIMLVAWDGRGVSVGMVVVASG